MLLEHLQFTMNLADPVRHETLEGKAHLVVPVAMMTEGVHKGSNGPLYYPKTELSKTPVVWNHKPVVVYHPEINGQGVSACSPTVLERRKVGIMLNTLFDNKLRCEAWLDEEKLDRVDNRIRPFIDDRKMMEVSTGLFTDNETTPGEWNGEKYTAIARNYRPDHLALLPDRVGACSIADGAGLLQTNAMSFSNVSEAISIALRAKLGKNWEGWVNDVYPTFFIFTADGKLLKQSYLADDNGIKLVEDSVEVKRVTEYRTMDNSYVGNSQPATNVWTDAARAAAAKSRAGRGGKKRTSAFARVKSVQHGTRSGTHPSISDKTSAQGKSYRKSIAGLVRVQREAKKSGTLVSETHFKSGKARPTKIGFIHHR